jgi:hypothetical protein
MEAEILAATATTTEEQKKGVDIPILSIDLFL